MAFIVVKYISQSGECPLDNFIDELLRSGCKDEVSKIKSYIRLLEINGNAILKNCTWAKKIGTNLYELRPKSSRILYFVCINSSEFVLLHGFKKKTQKTPDEEITKANAEAKDYERRKKNGI